MPDRSSKPTPIPKSSEDLAIIVARIDDRTRTMAEQSLPRVEKAATEARDGFIDLNRRVIVLETTPGHRCDEKPRQARQDEDIKESLDSSIEHEERIKTLFGFRNLLVGLLATVVFATGAFVVSSQVTDATARADIAHNKDDIRRHETIIEDLPRKADIERITQAVNELPDYLEKAHQPATADELENAAEDLPLKNNELRILRAILATARQREETIDEETKAPTPSKRIVTVR